MQRQQHDIGEQAPWNDEAVYERDVDKDAVQEIVHRPQMTTLSHLYTTKDRTEPYLAKLVRDLIKDYKEQELDVQESALFLRDRLHEGLYCGRKGKRYATEVVSNREAVTEWFRRTTQTTRRASRTMTKRLKAEDNPKKALKLEDKPEEDQGHASVLPAAGAKKQPRKPRDMPKESKARTV